MSFDRNLGRFPCRCEASMEFFSRVDGSQKMFSISVAFGEQNMAGHRFTSHHTNKPFKVRSSNRASGTSRRCKRGSGARASRW